MELSVVWVILFFVLGALVRQAYLDGKELFELYRVRKYEREYKELMREVIRCQHTIDLSFAAWDEDWE